jgi:hypothetical protein
MEHSDDFFSFAIADGAFKGYHSLKQLMAARILEGRDSWVFKWNNAVIDLPVLRMASPKGVESRGLTYAALWGQISELGKRVGH